MAFFNKAGTILRQAVSKNINHEVSSTNPSIFQMIRCMSSSKLFIGGLPWATDDASLREHFSKYGDVQEARVIIDRETGRSRGFGFVTYSQAEAAGAAIQAMDQQELDGRRVRVNYANDRQPRDGGYGGGGYGGGGYASGGYGGGGYGGGGGGGYGGNSYGNRDGGDGGYGSSYGGGSQNVGVAGGIGGSDSFVGGTGGGDSAAVGGYGGFDNNDIGSSSFAGADGGEDYKDDDGPDDFADRRA